MDLQSLIVRPAITQDLKSIAEIKVSGWQNSYRGIINDDYLDAMSVQNQINAVSSYPLESFFVIENDFAVLGFCRIAIYNFTNNEMPDSEIREIYVRPDLKRHGIGSRLFKYVLEELRKRGCKNLRLGVLKQNRDARLFYEKIGGKLKDEGSISLLGEKYPTVSYEFDLISCA